jgi:3-methyladenine DNA glycosylase AlkD
MLDLQSDLRSAADTGKAAFFSRFFKTGKGQYAEGDKFLGLSVPAVREAIRPYASLPLSQIALLLRSEWHEERLAGLLLLVHQYKRGDAKEKQAIVDFYLVHLDYADNWDLVDSSADKILGQHLLSTGETKALDRLADSGFLWRERVAIVATFAFIRAHDFRPTFRIAKKFLNHPHDLIHKATGWMLREVGKRDERALRAFLDRHGRYMPRTMLRYAIERFSASLRAKYMVKK